MAEEDYGLCMFLDLRHQLNDSVQLIGPHFSHRPGYIACRRGCLCLGAFHSTKNSEISGLKLNGTVKIPEKVFENLGIRFECTLFDGVSGIIENFVFHSQEMSGLFLRPSVSSRGHLEKWRP